MISNISELISSLRYKKLPTLLSCETVKLVGAMDEMDGKYLSQFFSAEFVANRTGAWFLGMIAFDGSIPSGLIDGENCSVNQIDINTLSKKSFSTAHYTTRIYASGCYFFNKGLYLCDIHNELGGRDPNKLAG